MVITIEMLEDLDACDAHVVVFKRIFGKKAEVNRDNAYKAIRAGLDLDWFVQNMLDTPQVETFALFVSELREAYTRTYSELYDTIFQGQNDMQGFSAAIAPHIEAVRDAIARKFVEVCEEWEKTT